MNSKNEFCSFYDTMHDHNIQYVLHIYVFIFLKNMVNVCLFVIGLGSLKALWSKKLIVSFECVTVTAYSWVFKMIYLLNKHNVCFLIYGKIMQINLQMLIFIATKYTILTSLCCSLILAIYIFSHNSTVLTS